jgi:hypothetical protein
VDAIPCHTRLVLGRADAPQETCDRHNAGQCVTTRGDFITAAQRYNLVPVYTRLTSDQLTPVTAYRCLVAATDYESPSFLFEGVQNGTEAGRFSFVGAHPALELLAKGSEVTILDHEMVCPSVLGVESVQDSWTVSRLDTPCQCPYQVPTLLCECSLLSRESICADKQRDPCQG